MSTFVFCAETGCGGFGDRLVGLVSAYIISVFANRTFKIWIKTPDMSSVLQTHPEYQLTDSELKSMGNAHRIMTIDQIHQHKEFLSTKNVEKEWASHPTILWFGNQYIHHFLWNNPHYQQNELVTNVTCTNFTRQVYQWLFTYFFVPTRLLHTTLNAFILNNQWSDHGTRHIGIQIRLGDHQIAGCNLYSGSDQRTHDAFNHVWNQVSKTLNIEENVKESNDSKLTVYVATDGKIEWIHELQKKYEGSNLKIVTFEGGPVQHLDKQHVMTVSGLLKLLVDLLMLSKCEHMIIPHHSNISRVAALSSVIREDVGSVLYTMGADGQCSSQDATDSVLFTKHLDGRVS